MFLAKCQCLYCLSFFQSVVDGVSSLNIVRKIYIPILFQSFLEAVAKVLNTLALTFTMITLMVNKKFESEGFQKVTAICLNFFRA